MSARPPRLARWLLRLVPLDNSRAEIEADLLELFAARVETRGIRHARWRYYHDVFSLWRKPLMQMPSLHSVRRSGRFVPQILRDLLYAGRLLRQNPGAGAVTIAGLAIAISVSTAVFSVLNVAGLRPTGAEDPSSAVTVLRAFERGNSTAWPYSQYLRLRENVSQIHVEAVLPDAASFSDVPGSHGNESVGLRFVTGGYLPRLNNRTTHGRLLGEADDVPGAPPVVVVSHRFWSYRLGADPGAVGRRIWLNGKPFTVAGVAARRFTGTRDTPPAFWLPIGTYHVLYGGSPFDRNSAAGVSVVGRIKPGISQAEAQAAASATVVSLGPDGAEPLPSPISGVLLTPIEGPSASGRTRTAIVIAIVLTVIGLLLLLACANVANLLLASALARRTEIGVRLALGASRWRIVRQLLTESLSLGLVAGGLGLLLTIWLVPTLMTFVRAPVTVDAAPDARVYLFLTVISVVAGIGAGVAAAMHAMRDDPASQLKGSGTRAAPLRQKLRATLVGAQAAASIMLLVLAALLARAMVRATQIEIGFDAHRLLVVSAAFGRSADATKSKVYWESAVDRVRSLPGVQGVSLAEYPPFSNAHHVTVLNRGSSQYTIFHNDTSADYFATLGLRAIRGRTYTPEEVRSGAKVAVISESLARDFFPGEDPLGQQLDRIAGDRSKVIIGIVPSAITARLREVGSATIYSPLDDMPAARLVIRTVGPPEQLVQPARAALEPLDPDVRITVRTVSEGLRQELDEPRILASLAGTLACIALGLALVGLYGLTTFIVRHRYHEIGVRMALGASGRDIRRLFLVDSLRPVVIGLCAGILAALIGGRVLSGVLYGIGSTDPLSFAVAASVLLLAAVAAVAIPARRAARVDPSSLLRQL